MLTFILFFIARTAFKNKFFGTDFGMPKKKKLNNIRPLKTFFLFWYILLLLLLLL